MPESPPNPKEIAAALARRLIGQTAAVREISIALAKRLSGLDAGNVLLIGSSGTGKTTLMRAVEGYLASDPELARRGTQIRIHAKVLAEEAARGRHGQIVLRRLLERAREQAAADEETEELLQRAAQGIVFVDEVDKIRATIGGRPHLQGIRAQEALLTLIENEAVSFELPAWAGGGSRLVDASRLWFVCAGAFEGLYDHVYDRVTLGADRGALKPVTVVDGDRVSEETRFRLADWLRNRDLYDYGMTPQFLSRFDARVLLEDLDQEALVRIFLESPESGYFQSRAFFERQGVELAISPAAVRRIASEAAREPRLGARAMNEVFRRVIRSYEFDPRDRATGGTIVIDLPEVAAALEH